VVSGYALTFGLTLVAGGRLGDAYGRGRMMLVGLSLFVVASAAVGLAPNATLVVVARLAQGAAAGLLTPQNSGLIQQLFHGEERGRAFGLFGLTVSIASATGPVLGGLMKPLAGLSDAPDSAVNRLPAVPGVEFGIIAAASDGKVPVAATHLPGEADHLVVDGFHSFLMNRRDVQDQVLHFLQTGRFRRGG